MGKLCLLIGIVLLQAFVVLGRKERFTNCKYAEDICPNEYIKFYLYKNETRSTPVEINPLQLDAKLFQPQLPIEILIHGFIGSRDKSPNAEVRGPLLQTQNVFVISVDYSPLVELPCYFPWTRHNVPIVSKCLAKLINNLNEQVNYGNDDIHLIGFSLGAQIAGLAANHVKQRLRRITALDPARFGFLDADDKSKLDKSDADFVDVVHTDPYLFALLEPAGHADFYVNFPNPVQPGCNFRRNGYYFNCNHFRAPVYYAESIIGKQAFTARNCGNWADFLLQVCDRYKDLAVAEMGYFVSERANGSYFLTTNDKPPYAKKLDENFPQLLIQDEKSQNLIEEF